MMKHSAHNRVINLATAALALGMCLSPAPRFARAQVDSEEAAATEPFLVRLYAEDRNHLNAVAGELDIWEAHPEAAYAVALVTPDQYTWLLDLGYRVDIDEAGMAAAADRAVLDPRYYYFDDYRTNINSLYVLDFLYETNAAYPGLTELYDIGDAWLADQPGEYDRDIWVLRITNEDPAYGPIENKPVFFLFATIHAREVSTPELAIRYIQYLTTGYNGAGGYGVHPDVTWLVNHNVAHIIVMQNPDGHWVNEGNPGQYRRKNMDWDDGCSDQSKWGVDLNRNHSFLWGCCGGSSGNPCDTTYRGPSRASEPETQAFEAYFASIMLDRNGPNGNDEIPPAAPDDTSGIFISLHSYSDLVLWPWGFQGFGDSPNAAQLETIGRKFAYFTGYDPTGVIAYDVDGATDDWTYGKYGVASFTFEVGANTGNTCGGFFPPYGCVDGIDDMPRSFWAENKPAFVYAHKIARTPYRTAYGPDAQGVAFASGGVPQGTAADLTATIADHRYGDEPVRRIAGAEYFVDAPGEDGTGSPMAPGDGDWGGQSETAIASVDTAGLALGRHYVLVHGRDAEGNWGPLTAAFLDVDCRAGDFDCDGLVDLADYAVFPACLAGPAVTTPPAGCSADEFHEADLDNDADVDAADLATFQSIFAP